MCLKFLLRDDFESLLCWLDHWLSCMLDCIHVCVFLLSENYFEKLARHLLDTSSTPHCLSRFFNCFLSLSWQLLDTWWIDRESSCLLDSFSTLGGLIELLFLDLMSCSSIPQLSMTISSIPTSIAYSIPASIKLYWGSIYSFFVIRFSFLRSLSICPHLFISQTLSLPLQTSSFVIIQAFSRFFFSW